MGIDFGQFKDLTPERRARELQKLVDSLREQIKEREEDIKRAEHFLVLADEEARLLEQIAVPEAKPVRKKEVLEEKAEEKPGRLEEKLELEQLLATAPKREELIHRVAHLPADVLYSTAQKIYARQHQTGVETQKDREMIYAIRRGLDAKKEDMEEGQYKPDRRSKHLLTATEQMTESMYKGAEGWYRK